MNRLFAGTNAFNYKQVGCMNDYGTEVYRGQSTLGGTLIGTIDPPYVFRVNGREKVKIGRYSQEKVYRLSNGSEELIGSYDSRQNVYKGSGANRQQIGYYEGRASGAAALLLLFN